MQNSRINFTETERFQCSVSPKYHVVESSCIEGINEPVLESEQDLDKTMETSLNNVSSSTIDVLHNNHKTPTYLEDNNKIMTTRIQQLFNDNKVLYDRIKILVAENLHLKQIVNHSLTNNKSQNENKKGESKFMKDVEISTNSQLLNEDKSIQIFSPCELCQGKLENLDFDGPSIILRTSEVEKLEHDMKILRDTVVSSERAWKELIEREKKYKQQIANLSFDIITNRHLLENRNNELHEFAQEITNKQLEVQELRKQVFILKKQVNHLKTKLLPREKSAADLLEHRQEALIEDIKERLINTKIKRDSKTRRIPFQESKVNVTKCDM